MIYTCTLNPSVDYFIRLPHLQVGHLNRVTHYEYRPGGKGINVSVLLHNIGVPSVVTGFFGGYQGQSILQGLQRYSLINAHPTMIEAMTRINVKISAEEETEINAGAPALLLSEVHQLVSQFTRLSPDDVVILSGSNIIHQQVSLYEQIAQMVNRQGATLVVDTSGHELRELLRYRPLLIKPNQAELELLFNRKATSIDEVIAMAQTLQQEGAQYVIVSLGAEGALLVTPEAVYRGNAPHGQVVNTIGSGDSLVAGFVATWLKTHDCRVALRYGIACGSASAFTDGIATQAEIDALLPAIHVIQQEVSR